MKLSVFFENMEAMKADLASKYRRLEDQKDRNFLQEYYDRYSQELITNLTSDVKFRRDYIKHWSQYELPMQSNVINANDKKLAKLFIESKEIYQEMRNTKFSYKIARDIANNYPDSIPYFLADESLVRNFLIYGEKQLILDFLKKDTSKQQANEIFSHPDFSEYFSERERKETYNTIAENFRRSLPMSLKQTALSHFWNKQDTAKDIQTREEVDKEVSKTPSEIQEIFNKGKKI